MKILYNDNFYKGSRGSNPGTIKRVAVVPETQKEYELLDRMGGVKRLIVVDRREDPYSKPKTWQKRTWLVRHRIKWTAEIRGEKCYIWEDGKDPFVFELLREPRLKNEFTYDSLPIFQVSDESVNNPYGGVPCGYESEAAKRMPELFLS